MRISTQKREVASSGITESVRFGLSMENEAHLKKILRNNIYSDKILAVLREYAANAWDAHRMVGKQDVPIKVHIPRWHDPTLIIQDFGPGLSHEDVFTVFTQYGSSTKRDTNNAVGMLGIGSKAGFAYTDTFTVISCHGGKKRTYVAMLDEDDNDALSLLGEEDCGDETGLTIQLAVHKNDVREFEHKARILFQYFNPRPDINITLSDRSTIWRKYSSGVLLPHRWSEEPWQLIMGCIPYRIDLEQLKDSNGNLLIDSDFLRVAGLIYADIGEVDISASRESLEYTQRTKDFLVKKFDALLVEYLKSIYDKIEQQELTNWEKRFAVHAHMVGSLGHEHLQEWCTAEFELSHIPFKSFFTPVRSRITVSPHTKIVLEIENEKRRSLKHYDMHYQYVQVRRNQVMVPDPKDPNNTIPKKDSKGRLVYYTWDEVRTELNNYLRAHKLDGIPIVELKDIPYNPPSKTQTLNIKHRAKMFEYKHTEFSPKYSSENWEVIERETQDDDVVVVLDRFEVVDLGDFRKRQKQDRRLAELFGLTLPPIYGYKTTARKPITYDDIRGIPYPKWREEWLKNLPIQEHKEQLEMAAAVHFFADYRLPTTARGLVTAYQNLGSHHPVVKFLARGYRAKKRERHHYRSHKFFSALLAAGAISYEEWPIYKQAAELEVRYPLIAPKHLRRFFEVSENDRTPIYQYIRDMDELYQYRLNSGVKESNS